MKIINNLTIYEISFVAEPLNPDCTVQLGGQMEEAADTSWATMEDIRKHREKK